MYDEVFSPETDAQSPIWIPESIMIDGNNNPEINTSKVFKRSRLFGTTVGLDQWL
jgi:hypothetical protein